MQPVFSMGDIISSEGDGLPTVNTRCGFYTDCQSVLPVRLYNVFSPMKTARWYDFITINLFWLG